MTSMETDTDEDDRWRSEFYRQLEAATNAMAPQFRAKALGGLTQETYDKAMVALNSARGTAADGVTPQFKHWAKNKFQLLGEGPDHQALHGLQDGKPVITYERIFDVVRDCHLAVGHQGIKKTRLQTVNNYSGIGLPMKAVEICVALCACAKTKMTNKKVLPTVTPGKASFLTRMQMDLIDMRSQPDGNFKWILQLRDHFSKFSWAFALTENRGGEAARQVALVFAMFGAAKVLQTHSGKKFAAQVNHALSDTWPGLLVVNRRPRNQPPTKSSAVISDTSSPTDRNGTSELEASLRRWRQDTSRTDWARALQHCVYEMNVMRSAGSDSGSPYEVVFGQPPQLSHQLPEPDCPGGPSELLDDVDSNDMTYSHGSGTMVKHARRRQPDSTLSDGDRLDGDRQVVGNNHVGMPRSGANRAADMDANYLMSMTNGHVPRTSDGNDKMVLSSHQAHHQLQHQQDVPSVCEFTAIEELGRGNYGSVFKVQDRVVGGVAKALKVLNLSLGPYESALYRRVGELLVSLFHENTVRVHRVLFLDEPYNSLFRPPGTTNAAVSSTIHFPVVALVTELCDDSLKARLRRRHGLDPDWNLYVLRQIMQGLQFLHSNGLVHRDLRPANCLIKGDRIKLNDFGLASLADFNAPARLAAAGGYLAPEVAAGGPFDVSADVYSVGVIAAELYAPSEAFEPWMRAGTGQYRSGFPVAHQAPHCLANFAVHMMREPHFRPSLVMLITNI